MTTTTPGSTANVPSVQAKVGHRDKTVPWYSPKLNQLGASGRELLENYSKIPPAEVEAHVYKMRDEIWDVFPYPCVGEFRFLDLAISVSPDYPGVLQRLRSGQEKFLDLGCCVGQDLRKLAYDGAVAESLYGADVRAEFFEMGYRLFRDRETLRSRFIEADIMDASSALSGLDGEIDIVYAGSFLHLFDHEGQKEACKRLVKLVRGKKGSLVFGRQVGNVDAAKYVQRSKESGFMNRHDAESFKRMWESVGKETGTKWRVEVDFELFAVFRNRVEGWFGSEPGVGMMRFSVFRE